MLPTQPAPDHAFFQLSEQYQRDRLWSLFGPALLDCSWSPAHPAWLPETPDWALQQRINLLPAPEYRSHRLGLKFEQLWQQYFDLTAERSEANVQLVRDGITLGEMDILTRIGERNWHLELALKFYLAVGDDWVGPNSRDRFYSKLGHTRHHQLDLSRDSATQTRLENSGWSDVLPQALMRGCLFYPAHRSEDMQLPAELNPDHWRGFWCHAASADAIPDGRWSILAKDQWMSPALVTCTVSREELIRYARLQLQYVSFPVCAVLTEEGPWGITEQQRWLIMPDHWPAQGTHKYLNAKP